MFTHNGKEYKSKSAVAIEMLKAGDSRSKIALTLGITYQTVYAVEKKIGLAKAKDTTGTKKAKEPKATKPAKAKVEKKPAKVKKAKKVVESDYDIPSDPPMPEDLPDPAVIAFEEGKIPEDID